MATESNYFSANWWSWPPNNQLPYYPCEPHPLPPSFILPLQATPSLHLHVPHPILRGFVLFVCHSIHYPSTSSVSSSLIYWWAECLVWIDLYLCILCLPPVCFQWGKWSLHDLTVFFPDNLGALKHIISITDAQVKDVNLKDLQASRENTIVY